MPVLKSVEVWFDSTEKSGRARRLALAPGSPGCLAANCLWFQSALGAHQTQVYVRLYICIYIYIGALAGLRMVTEFCYFGEVALWTNSDIELLTEPVSPNATNGPACTTFRCHGPGKS